MIRNLSKRSEREQILGAAVLLALLGWVFYAGICGPQVLRLNATRAKLAAQEGFLNLKRQTAEDQTASEQRRGSLIEEVEEADGRYFRRNDADRFLSGLNDLVASAGCRLVQAAFVSEERISSDKKAEAGTEPNAGSRLAARAAERRAKMGGECKDRPWAKDWDGPDLSQVSVRMAVVGRFEGLVTLLGRVETLGTKVHVGQMNVELVDHERADLNVSLVLSVFSIDKEEEG